MSLLSVRSANTPAHSALPTYLSIASMDTQAKTFATVLPWICVVGGLTHALFLGLFLWAGVMPLALANVASVLVYLAAFGLARRGKTELVTFLVGTEIVAHAVVATLVIGWASGFGTYIVLTLPVLVVSGLRSRVVKIGGVLLLAALYLGLDWRYSGRQAAVPVAQFVVLSLHYFNAVGVMAILTFLAALYAYVINETQGALREMAGSDPLTGLRNRRAMEDLIHHAEARLQRAAQPLSFVMCDLDRFKAINDAFGHATGDAVLQMVSRTMARSLRAADAIARWGGEEFLVMLAGTDQDEALLIAERMRAEVEQQSVVSASGTPVHVTMSVGVATVRAQETAERAIARADAAQYQGKGGGGNRVVLESAGRAA
jgi:diguanylate cyclase (GGDEF)-like protein